MLAPLAVITTLLLGLSNNALTVGVGLLAGLPLASGGCTMPSLQPTTAFPTTFFPTFSPTREPTKFPTTSPTNIPTNAPTNTPTNTPSTSTPTKTPTSAPTNTPTNTPTNAPTNTPTNAPTNTPTPPTTSAPTSVPTSSGTPVNYPANNKPAAPFVADVNNDTIPDVLVANIELGSTSNPSGSLSVYLGTGGGGLAPPVVYTGGNLSSNAVVAADVNGDGYLDAITVNGQTNLPAITGFIGVYLNRGSASPGTFFPMVQYPTGGSGSIHLCAGDFNGDSFVDIAAVNLVTNTMSVLLGNGTGAFGAPTDDITILSAGGVQSTVGCRDLNGDSKTDIVVTSPASARITVFLTGGAGAFGLDSGTSYSNSMNGQTAGVAFGDMDGDGNLDIASNGAAGRYIFFFRGQGAGSFTAGVASTVGSTAVANSALGVVLGQFDRNDTHLDAYVLGTTSNGGVTRMQGVGDGTFTNLGFIATGATPVANAIAQGDMNGDGYADVVLTNRASGTVTILFG